MSLEIITEIMTGYANRVQGFIRAGGEEDRERAAQRRFEAILNKHLDENVVWNYASSSTVPWLMRREGIVGALLFFDAHDELEVLAPPQPFNPPAEGPFKNDNNEMIGRTHVLFLEALLRIKANGRSIREKATHIWHFNNRKKVVAYHMAVDSHLHHLAYSGSDQEWLVHQLGGLIRDRQGPPFVLDYAPRPRPVRG